MAKLRIWRDSSTPPSTSYIWYRLNEYDRLVGWFKYDGGRWVLIRNTELNSISSSMQSGGNVTSKTTEQWDNAVGYIPAEGEIIVYSDYKKVLIDGELTDVPAIKIGDGISYVQDLVFVGHSDVEIDLQTHIEDDDRHINEGERDFWNNKVSVDLSDTESEMLVFKID